MNSAKVISVTDPVKILTCDDKEEGEISPVSSNLVTEKEVSITASTGNFMPANATTPSPPGINVAPAVSTPSVGKDQEKQSPNKTEKHDLWTSLFKGGTKKLQKKGESFLLPSGESCVTIPNSVIEKNRTSWDSFIIGQFYSDPPSQGTIQTIVNGIWSKQFRDITVSKMEGFAFLFRIPNASTRAYVLKQCLWQIEGQTMFVAKWEPGIVPVKPELTSAPIWLELRDVPLQFFNEEALEHIAGQVGDPKFLHPQTANKTNLEVAKVFTIIDPRVPLPEAVNARFESGEIRRIRVSSPWMPPVCSFCKEVGHSLRRCKKAPITCKACKSTTHFQADCTRSKGKSSAKPEKDHKKSPPKVSKRVYVPVDSQQQPQTSLKNSTASFKNMENGGTSGRDESPSRELNDHKASDKGSLETSAAESDSSDIDSDSRLSDDSGYCEVVYARQKKKDRGRGPKLK